MSLAGVISSVSLTQHKQLTQNSKANMPKSKKTTKVRDLKPSKDAKGGGAGVQGSGVQGSGVQGSGLQGSQGQRGHRHGHRIQ
jgi:hypothetical protein